MKVNLSESLVNKLIGSWVSSFLLIQLMLFLKSVAEWFCLNRPFPSSCEPHYESEAKCKAFHAYEN